MDPPWEAYVWLLYAVELAVVYVLAARTVRAAWFRI